MLDWDDLRVFLACARTSVFRDAALRLRMDPSTVARRILRLEEALCTTLFVRSPMGLQMTPSGAELLEASQAVETAVELVTAGDSLPFNAGIVRLSASEGFGARILAPSVPTLLDFNPELRLELVANAGFLSASTREADIAITLAPPTSSRLSVERLTDYRLGLYGSASYLAEHGHPQSVEALKHHRLVGYIDDLLYADELRYLKEIHPELRARTTSSSIRAQTELTLAGAGLCVLPHFLAAEHGGLEPILRSSVQLTRSFWVSVHRDLQETRRVRLVRNWLLKTVTAQTKQLYG